MADEYISLNDLKRLMHDIGDPEGKKLTNSTKSVLVTFEGLREWGNGEHKPFPFLVMEIFTETNRYVIEAAENDEAYFNGLCDRERWIQCVAYSRKRRPGVNYTGQRDIMGGADLTKANFWGLMGRIVAYEMQDLDKSVDGGFCVDKDASLT